MVGARAGRHLDVVLTRSWAVLGSFIQGQAAVGLVDAVLIGIGLVVVGVPLALPLAVLTFFGGFVPIIGAFVVGALAVLVALVSNGTTAALIILAVIFAVQQIEGNVLQPVLQGKSLALHPAVVLLVVTAGGSLYGIAGAFFAVPVAAVVAVVLRYLGELLEAETGEPTPGADPQELVEEPAPAEPGASAGARESPPGRAARPG
jgi:predicted PurR-regulated permease PerM